MIAPTAPRQPKPDQPVKVEPIFNRDGRIIGWTLVEPLPPIDVKEDRRDRT